MSESKRGERERERWEGQILNQLGSSLYEAIPVV